MKILEILRRYKETSLVLSGMDALSNIANDQSSVEKLLSKGLVEHVLESMQANDWDEELSECTVKLLHLFRQLSVRVRYPTTMVYSFSSLQWRLR